MAREVELGTVLAERMERGRGAQSSQMSAPSSALPLAMPSTLLSAPSTAHTTVQATVRAMGMQLVSCLERATAWSMERQRDAWWVPRLECMLARPSALMTAPLSARPSAQSMAPL